MRQVIYGNGLLPRLPMPGMPPKPPRPNGDCAGSGGGAPVFPVFRKKRYFLKFLPDLLGWQTEASKAKRTLLSVRQVL